MAKKGSIERNLLQNVRYRRNRQSVVMVLILFSLATLLIACMGYLRNDKASIITNSLSGDFMTIETPDSTNFRYDYEGFISYFNPKWRVPSAVVYELTHHEQLGTESRKGKRFKTDPKVTNSANDKDYVKSGFDRGHLAPSADMSWSKNVIEESFFFTNIAPQNGNLNSGQWSGVESLIREWGKRDSALVIITGTIFNGNIQTIGANNVGVPTQLYKIVFAPYVETPRMIAFLYDNIKPINQLSDYVVTVDEIEKLTGNDFFTKLPNKLERKLERSSNLELWKRDE